MAHGGDDDDDDDDDDGGGGGGGGGGGDGTEGTQEVLALPHRQLHQPSGCEWHMVT